MGVEASWGAATRRVILVEFTGDWAWSQFQRVQGQVYTMLDSASAPVGVVWNMLGTTYLPPQGFTRNMQDVNALTCHPRFAIILVVMPHSSLRQMLATIFTLHGNSESALRFCETLDEAYQLVQQHFQRA